ncbi:heme-binding protein [Rhizobium deserti]|uniref:Heme-binding protein n=1 Tax=Rhizobium deserti TaxID=2547961 RepID=A0A4R5UP42_9HYPH|nr:heme-binding protein [Rhizobium deserti]TDK39681.1 heme-binding protein [Rhizobium deserti]
MPYSFTSLSLADARSALDAGLAVAEALGVPCSIAIVEASGQLIGFARPDKAMLGSAELAINKAFTAAIFQNSTEAIGRLATPGAELYGIQNSHAGRVVIFGGGIPILIGGKVVGAIGVSGGTVAQDIEIANAAQANLPSVRL